ncbi:MAG: hypothetical protein Q9174_001248 [Haloplaca sp. 1 TL-2023]
MAPSKPAYDVDWIWSNTSNVHVANHRDWFTSYTPFSSKMGSMLKGIESEVIGIGDVELPTKSHPTRNGPAYRKVLHLKNVLHAPGSVCNIFATSILEGYQLKAGPDGPGAGFHLISEPSGTRVALIDFVKLYRVRLCGQSAQQTSLDRDSVYYINAMWSAAERSRWEAHQQREQTGPTPSLQPADHKQIPKPDHDLPLIDAEKKWLKDNYKDEFHFLEIHNLSIYKDEDRSEGRRILRAMMDAESDETPNHSGDQGASGSDNSDDSEEEGSQTSFERDLEENPASHFADRHFSEEQLDWIKREYGHSGNFLMSYGLKFYDDEDCKEGVSIIQAEMEDNEDDEDDEA